MSNTRPRHDGEPAMLEFADEFNAKLSGRPEDYRTFAHRNTTIANESTGSKVSTVLGNAKTS
jgi:hypothetical protein